MIDAIRAQPLVEKLPSGNTQQEIFFTSLFRLTLEVSRDFSRPRQPLQMMWSSPQSWSYIAIYRTLKNIWLFSQYYSCWWPSTVTKHLQVQWSVTKFGSRKYTGLTVRHWEVITMNRHIRKPWERDMTCEDFGRNPDPVLEFIVCLLG